MKFDFSGAQVLVTGGINGIGGGITKEFIKAGARVFATTRLDENSKEVLNFRDESGANENLVIVSTELQTNDAPQMIFEELKGLKSKINILINNAGHTLDVTNPHCDLESWQNVFFLNFFLHVELTRLFLPQIKQARYGRIINVTSCAGLENSGPVTFSAAKAALTAYTRSMGRVLAIEVPNVVMSAAYPGVIETAGGHWEAVRKTDPNRVEKYIKERCPLGRFGEIEEFVPLVMFLASEANSFAHGAIMGVDGGQSKHYNYFNYLD